MVKSKNVTKPVPYLEQVVLRSGDDFNWLDAQIFALAAKHGSFRVAAQHAGLSYNTVRRHIERLEKAVGALLLVRHPNGYQLTSDGLALLDAAQSMEAAALGIRRFSSQKADPISGRVKVSITEGLGTFWLIPRLVRFQRANPNVIVEANCTFRTADVANMEADIAVQFSRPVKSNVKVVRLGCLHVIPFVSPEYFQMFGAPRSLEELKSHKLVEQLSPQLDVSAVDRLFPNKAREGFISIATNTSTAHFWSVVSGGGVGMLPSYLSALGARILPIDFGFQLKHEIWLTYHPDARKQRRVSVLIDWIRENFNPEYFPWFANAFVHPDHFSHDGALVQENQFKNILVR